VTRVASLGMYDFPWLREATDALWVLLRDSLRRAGVEGVPDALDRSRPVREIWRDPNLLLAQTCGYPLVTELVGVVRLVATPVYHLPGCEGGLHRSFVVVRADDPAQALADLRGRRCAVNAFHSNTGMNLLRAAVAPLAGGGRFFGSVVETGAHLNSLRAVREDFADVAAIDCVVYGLATRHQPQVLTGTRVLTETATTPGLPFVTARATSDLELQALRAALAATAGLPAAVSVGLGGFQAMDVGDYDVVSALERGAVRARYPCLA
jgi:ABC-type phosphate/phosphonate transport system substrate-binding protein